ncbi:alpha/beta fold hydrolase [Pusillimonas sp. TS35]|uniref:alpha/beta fold hydrolase n=1 Tax=Paracandidimonas lactea TaxID=2895524 RepID=UPI00136B0268|nr:alpha/beta fold hydrolase [Paracandidimonas lactea]MYN15092.1 alpha/beta fold hydrolase [Pusillimonas sp. TS35]
MKATSQATKPEATATHTYVLVHGAWCGGWCWSRVAHRLRKAGHRVFTPTCTGLGERSHLLAQDTGLDTFVRDIANVLQWEDLRDVILVGHSFGGLVITGVADIMRDRIGQLVYLDAFILESGIRTIDTLSTDNIEKLREGVAKSGGPVPVLAPPRPQSLSLEAAEDITFVEGRLTPQPYRSYTSALTLHNPVGNTLSAAYIQCTEPVFRAVSASADWARDQGWPVYPLATSHCAMITAPDATVGLLLELAGGHIAAS